MNGPYNVRGGSIEYLGNRVFPPACRIVRRPPDATKRHLSLMEQPEYWTHLLDIDSKLQELVGEYFRVRGARLVDVPLLTRSISSPGALLKRRTIISDVRPFRVDYFGFEGGMYLSQSSQLYLEAYLTMDQVPAVYAVSKSFRNEKADYRHLTEFRHVEYEARGSLDDVLATQEEMLQVLVSGLLGVCKESLAFFLSDEDVQRLAVIHRPFTRITFADAFSALYHETGEDRYAPGNESVVNFDAQAEILLTRILSPDQPVFVTHYPTREVAFYHATSPQDPNVALNADCLFPGYGEVIGSGQRILTRPDYQRKMQMFRLNADDYEWYAEIRDARLDGIVHSGFGMGIERFLAAMLRLPSVEHAVPFPRVSQQTRP